MEAIHTQRLILRNFLPQDGVPLREMIAQYMASPYGKFDRQWPTDEQSVAGVSAWFAQGDSYLAVCSRADGGFLGFVSLNPGEDNAFDLGYCLDFRQHGRGYALEACRAALRHAFEQLGAARITSGTARDNAPSCRLLGRLGFVITGQGEGSFANDEHGQPIVFTGYAFELTRERYLMLQKEGAPTAERP